MLIKKNIPQDHPESTDYEFVVSTDSAIEKDLIEKHLDAARKEYRLFLKKQTKTLPSAHVVASVNSLQQFPTLNALHPHVNCAKCAHVIFYEPVNAEFFRVDCPYCNSHTIVEKGE